MSTIRANSITNSAGSGAPDFPNGLTDNGVAVATTADVAAIATGPTLGTAVASTSGTAIDFTGIPSTAKRVTVMFNGVSLTGFDFVVIQLGTSGGFVTSGYAGSYTHFSATAASTTIYGSGFRDSFSAGTASLRHGSIVFNLMGSNTWTASGSFTDAAVAEAVLMRGSVALSGVLDRVRITRSGTNAFDAGTINISWE